MDCCSWEGIGCDDSGRVTDLWLPSQGLVGSISPTIRNLTSLSRLSLYNNSLSGPLPDRFFASFNRLQVVDLSHNFLSGAFMGSDKLPVTVRMIDLSSNSFDGALELLGFEGALELETFDIGNNGSYGLVPLYICRFSSMLRRLDFSNNGFQGSIPEGFGLCSNLQSIRAGFNDMSGGLPKDTYSLLNLQELYLPGMKLFGQIDKGITNLTNLKILDLHGNDLTGLIQQDIGRLSTLETLLLHANQINGAKDNLQSLD